MSVGAPDGTPDELKAGAATLLERATAKDGSGFRFEIVQRSTITARPGGPKIEIPDPADGSKSLGTADAYYLNGLVETGYVTPDGFSMEMRAGPATANEKVDLAGGQLLFRTLVRDGLTYRDDGEGWYATDSPPGIGLDPRTVSLLPKLLRDATQASDAEPPTATAELLTADGAARALVATAMVANIPGVIAADGEPFSELTEPVTLAFDTEGRLSGIIITARNTNLDVYDLIVVTEIVIRYDAVPTDLPDPVPTAPPDVIPVSEP